MQRLRASRALDAFERAGQLCRAFGFVQELSFEIERALPRRQIAIVLRAGLAAVQCLVSFREPSENLHELGFIAAEVLAEEPVWVKSTNQLVVRATHRLVVGLRLNAQELVVVQRRE